MVTLFCTHERLCRRITDEVLCFILPELRPHGAQASQPHTHSAASAGVELLIVLFLSLKCWECKRVVSHLALKCVLNNRRVIFVVILMVGVHARPVVKTILLLDMQPLHVTAPSCGERGQVHGRLVLGTTESSDWDWGGLRDCLCVMHISPRT